ncbi:DMT family transporter [Insolitispirillum peregrinum]|uniref:Permease of the drug/metabolite transporter (DMT) superfamily n=1 Tax=Insolitispirillum peregrinum TaxID=80876 RepID=A0A1N7P427_9PROT|nr:DMT family transporter [Insolitispirillum peregrinum]SIT05341.1 Permease of the drug/metabolite transporter (DMT) superfamily [Insolitispirillum peregrinum]
MTTPPPPATRDWGKLGLIGLISLCWGLNWPAIKILLGYLPPFTLRALAFTAGAVLILAIARLSGNRLRVAHSDITPLVLGGLLNVLVFNLFTTYGQLTMATSRAAVITFTMPVWTTLLAIPVLKEKPGPRQWVGLVCGMSGLAVLLGPHGLDQGIGPFLMLGAAVSWALGTVLMKRRPWSTPPMVVTGWQYVLSAVPLVLLAAWHDPMPDFSILPAKAWVALGWHISLSICLAQVLWYKVIRRASAGEATIGTLLIPVIGVTGSLLILGETLTWSLLIALGLIVAAVAAGVLPFPRKPRLQGTG